MKDAEIIQAVTNLTSQQFENLVFDLVRAVGIRNLVWRTPGSDGGRDIEGEFSVYDPSGFSSKQKWYIECKRYSSSIDWPTVWEKIAYADSHQADVLLLATNSNPSPNCETEIARWNTDRRRPSVRVWRGYDFPRLLRPHPDIASAHGILGGHDVLAGIGVNYAVLLSKLIQAAHGATVFGSDPTPAIEAATSLSELLIHRLRDLRQYGHFLPGPDLQACPDWGWLHITGSTNGVEEVGFRAIAALARHFTQCTSISAELNSPEVVLHLNGAKFASNIAQEPSMQAALPWLLCDAFNRVDDTTYQFSQRRT